MAALLCLSVTWRLFYDETTAAVCTIAEDPCHTHITHIHSSLFATAIRHTLMLHGLCPPSGWICMVTVLARPATAATPRLSKEGSSQGRARVTASGDLAQNDDTGQSPRATTTRSTHETRERATRRGDAHGTAIFAMKTVLVFGAGVGFGARDSPLRDIFPGALRLMLMSPPLHTYCTCHGLRAPRSFHLFGSIILAHSARATLYSQDVEDCFKGSAVKRAGELGETRLLPQLRNYLAIIRVNNSVQ